ncbi:GNAT family N-acetyltransferase [Bradyrhizobium sp. U87765 SZCCT0131]|uniref:GNAT family N-acetyltransferase n=1 Tax=unclassified Bradyrhizobium TaxID=2631580 RepID=UPI001BA7CFD6|nr:GNAT family N-acetyltransferase [Bradyrhizobium sp. U87765 SZCCT0131]MBR1261567.1 GNAT family N-acetyltransferase [Bradyrhizobium sp. U87765 SZCCT0134]MBR1306580.1 GNAT family N-acetyltransferase [Bradyrhizobium sp. U87765 SZCCT0110]MBR1317349.1 GNAT family N-acetyltransferase [Bradyrhizobium sp. U87765 SZCCT0109]MBR1351051.1 GNAT family N-acetyltransferase [Bradyrhizobium sp. U87765 SZCCT0048]
MDIREARSDDWPAIWRIISPTIRAGETYALAPDMSEDEARAYWTGPDRRTFVAQASEAIVGTYYIRANNAGGGAHVCNCGYMTAAAAAGQGIARAMCAHSLEVARAMGYRAMQFNFVISVNVRAVRLWHDMGFVTVGVLPEAFAHPSKGYVDALVMSRRL